MYEDVYLHCNEDTNPEMDFYIRTNGVFTRNEIQPATKIRIDIILYNVSGYIHCNEEMHWEMDF